MRVPPGVPTYAALVQRHATLRSERRGWGWKSLTRHHFAHVVQCRDGALKTRTVSVRIRSWAPTACSPMKRHEAQTFESAGASPATRTNLCFVEFRLGRPIWNVNRTSEPGLGANECVTAGKWRKSTTFRHFPSLRPDSATIDPSIRRKPDCERPSIRYRCWSGR